MGSSPIRRATRRRSALLHAIGIAASFVLIAPIAKAAATAKLAHLAELSLEDLMDIEVVSASKKPQGRTETASAITVITADDIRRGGFTHLAEALRTVPGLEIGQVDANRWSISVRGNNSLFANKLLVLIDGRTVYTPVFGGTYWDIQDHPLEDIDRIEVIRGPGAAIWGVNAVNGVINILTKSAKQTRGTLASAYVGDREAGWTTRFGGAIGDEAEPMTAYRVHARAHQTKDYDVDRDGDGHDEWRHGRLGFRIDSSPSEADALRLSGDVYAQQNDQAALNPFAFPLTFREIHYEQTGGNLVGSWDRALGEDSSLQVKGYYSLDRRQFLLESESHTADLELQHDSVPFEHLSLSWGGGYRYTETRFSGRPVGISIAFDPDDEALHLATAFAQLQYDLFADRLSLIAGTKLSYDGWSGFQYQPTGRFVVKPAEGHAVWAAVSRAVRTPTQAERDISLVLPGALPVELTGDRGTRAEELTAFELGYRFYALERVNVDLTAFWNEYESLSNFVARIPPVPPPLRVEFSNSSRLSTRGVEVEVNVVATSWWRLRMAYSYLQMDEFEKASSLSFGKTSQQNPHHQFNVGSSFELPLDLEFDVSVYYVDGLPAVVPSLASPNDNVEQYVRLDLRLAYAPADGLEFALVGQNLNDDRHYESSDFTGGQSTQIPRSFYAKAVFAF